jgi:hypothetical protein
LGADLGRDERAVSRDLLVNTDNPNDIMLPLHNHEGRRIATETEIGTCKVLHSLSLFRWDGKSGIDSERDRPAIEK